MAARRINSPAALAASVALHLLLALAIWSLREPPRTPIASRPIEVVIAQRPKPKPRPAEPQAKAVEPVKPQPVPSKRHAVASSAPVIAAPPQAPVAASPAPEVPLAAPSDVPRAPDLSGAAVAVARRLDAPALVGPHGVDAPPVVADANLRTATLITSEQGKAHVQRGLVDPYFTQVSHALVKGWTTHSKILDPKLEDVPTQLARNSKVGMELYQQMAAKYGESGTPLDVPTDSPRDAAQTDLQARNDYRRQWRQQWRAAKRVLVRLTQSKGGLVQSVELVQSSQDPDLDAEVLRELRTGVITLPEPPTEGLGIRDPIRSVWAFELVVSISPPIPTITGAFDEVTRTIDVRRPLDRRVYKYVELVSVD